MTEETDKKTQNPFLNVKSVDTSEEKNNRWANLEIADESTTSNRFTTKTENSFRRDQNDSRFERGSKFLRWTKPRPPTPPPTFDLSSVNLDEAFPTLS